MPVHPCMHAQVLSLHVGAGGNIRLRHRAEALVDVLAERALDSTNTSAVSPRPCHIAVPLFQKLSIVCRLRSAVMHASAADVASEAPQAAC